MQQRTRVWRPDWPCQVRQTVGILRRGAGDPTFRTPEGGGIWRGIRTPEGPATLHLTAYERAGEVTGAAWGAGADWALEQLPAMLGADDDPSGFEPRHPVLAQAARRHPHWRLTRTGLVLEALVPAIIEQKVTGQEAFGGFRRLVHRFGERAPGPGAELSLWVQPSPQTIRTIPSWEWLRMHIDPARSRPLVTAAAYAANLERGGASGPEEADRRMRALPGIGVWTSAEVRFRALGDADAVSFGDYHIAKNVTWALTGRSGTTRRWPSCSSPTGRTGTGVQRLVELARLSRPRHGPRMAPRGPTCRLG